jgi:hypothetical protein
LGHFHVPNQINPYTACLYILFFVADPRTFEPPAALDPKPASHAASVDINLTELPPLFKPELFIGLHKISIK